MLFLWSELKSFRLTYQLLLATATSLISLSGIVPLKSKLDETNKSQGLRQLLFHLRKSQIEGGSEKSLYFKYISHRMITYSFYNKVSGLNELIAHLVFPCLPLSLSSAGLQSRCVRFVVSDSIKWTISLFLCTYLYFFYHYHYYVVYWDLFFLSLRISLRHSSRVLSCLIASISWDNTRCT